MFFCVAMGLWHLSVAHSLTENQLLSLENCELSCKQEIFYLLIQISKDSEVLYIKQGDNDYELITFMAI